MLLRSFGEDYHERMLEEAYIFPAIRKTGGRAAAYVDVLLKQHQKGREVTDYVLAVVSGGAVPNRDLERLATALEQFELMYEHHAAREDTIVFPAWKETMSRSQLDEMGEMFEEIEHRQFGADGFEKATATLDSVERSVGISDIAQFTPS